MKKREPVSHIMTANVHSIRLDESLTKAMELLRKYNVRHLPVVDGASVVGILSRSDLNRLTFGALFENQEGADESMLEMLTIPQVMTSKPRSVGSDSSIKEVAEIFAKEDFHSLPVVDENELKGIVTTTDVINYMLEQY